MHSEYGSPALMTYNPEDIDIDTDRENSAKIIHSERPTLCNANPKISLQRLLWSVLAHFTTHLFQNQIHVPMEWEFYEDSLKEQYGKIVNNLIDSFIRQTFKTQVTEFLKAPSLDAFIFSSCTSILLKRIFLPIFYLLADAQY